MAALETKNRNFRVHHSKRDMMDAVSRSRAHRPGSPFDFSYGPEPLRPIVTVAFGWLLMTSTNSTGISLHIALSDTSGQERLTDPFNPDRQSGAADRRTEDDDGLLKSQTSKSVIATKGIVPRLDQVRRGMLAAA